MDSDFEKLNLTTKTFLKVIFLNILHNTSSPYYKKTSIEIFIFRVSLMKNSDKSKICLQWPPSSWCTKYFLDKSLKSQSKTKKNDTFDYIKIKDLNSLKEWKGKS